MHVGRRGSIKMHKGSKDDRSTLATLSLLVVFNTKADFHAYSRPIASLCLETCDCIQVRCWSLLNSHVSNRSCLIEIIAALFLPHIMHVCFFTFHPSNFPHMSCVRCSKIEETSLAVLSSDGSEKDILHAKPGRSPLSPFQIVDKTPRES